MPPSACSTSQSTQTVRSPSAAKSTIAAQRAADQALDLDRCARRAGRAWSRAACARPSRRGASRTRRVTQPVPLPRSQRGTLSCTVAVQITRVRPIEKSTEPSAVSTKSGSRSSGRSSSAARPSWRLNAAPTPGRDSVWHPQRVASGRPPHYLSEQRRSPGRELLRRPPPTRPPARPRRRIGPITITPMRVVAVHQEQESSLDSLEAPVLERGHELVHWQAWRDPAPAELEGAGAVIVLGGLANPDQTDELPWLGRERDALARLVARRHARARHLPRRAAARLRARRPRPAAAAARDRLVARRGHGERGRRPRLLGRAAPALPGLRVARLRVRPADGRGAARRLRARAAPGRAARAERVGAAVPPRGRARHDRLVDGRGRGRARGEGRRRERRSWRTPHARAPRTCASRASVAHRFLALAESREP